VKAGEKHLVTAKYCKLQQ